MCVNCINSGASKRQNKNKKLEGATLMLTLALSRTCIIVVIVLTAVNLHTRSGARNHSQSNSSRSTCEGLCACLQGKAKKGVGGVDWVWQALCTLQVANW